MALLPPIHTVLEHANITVKQPDELAETLCTLFSWRVRWSGDSIYGGRTVHVGNDLYYLALYTGTEPTNEDSELGSYQRENGLNHIGLTVNDLDAMEQHVLAAGYKTYSHNDYEPGRRFYFKVAGNLEFEMVSYHQAG